MNKYCLDSSIWIAYANGESEEIRKIVEESDMVTSSLSILEVSDKFIRTGKTEKQVREMMAFMMRKAKVIPLSVDISYLAARIKGAQRKKKPKFGIADGAHLATSRQEGTIFLTKDDDFRKMKDVKILS